MRTVETQLQVPHTDHSIYTCVGVAGGAPVLASNDAVPFRFTPNMQNFLGPIFTEGVLTSGMLAIGRCLTEPEVVISFIPTKLSADFILRPCSLISSSSYAYSLETR